METLHHGCDESKCVGYDNNGIPGIEGRFACYSDGSPQHPMQCSDGYLPVVIDDEPLLGGYLYHTCCPPTNHETTTTITRSCSDPILVGDDDGYAAVCESRDDNRRYPCPMELFESSSEIIAAIVCCDNNNNNNNTMDFLDEVDCVPYSDDSTYKNAEVPENLVGLLGVMVCDVEGFPHPRPIHNSLPHQRNGTMHWPYQCCKTGPAVHFRQDAAFRTTVYPALFMFFLSALASMIVATALLIPFLIERKNRGGNLLSQRSSQRVSVRRSSFTEPRVVNSRRRSFTEPRMSRRSSFNFGRDTCYSTYSTYNLYIFALALADFLYCLFQFALYGSAIDQQFRPPFYGSFIDGKTMIGNNFIGMSVDFTLGMAYFTANIWINGIVAYQILELLRSSQQRQRIHQPSHKKALRQIGSVFLLSAAVGIGLFFLYEARINNINAGNIPRGTAFHLAALVLLFLMVLSPPVYVLYVAIYIKCRGLIPPVDGASAKNKAVRGLTLYLFRILAVFYGMWLPAVIMIGMFELSSAYGHAMYLQLITFCLFGLQPLVSTAMFLTKDDVRKYVWDLVTLAYVFGRKDEPRGIDTSHRPPGSYLHGGGSSQTTQPFSVPFAPVQANSEGNATAEDTLDGLFGDSVLSGCSEASHAPELLHDSKKKVTFDPVATIERVGPSPTKAKGKEDRDGSIASETEKMSMSFSFRNQCNTNDDEESHSEEIIFEVIETDIERHNNEEDEASPSSADG